MASDWKRILRGSNPIRDHSPNQDLYVRLTDWFGADSDEIRQYLDGKLLRTKEEQQNYSNEAEDDDEEEYSSRFLVYAFGLDELGNSICIKMTDFRPYFFIKVPDNWLDSHVDVLMEYLKKKIWPKKYATGLIQYKLIRAKPYYGFTANDQFNFVKLVFHDHQSFWKWSYTFKKPHLVYGLNFNKQYKYDLYESNINPMIRLTHIREISPSGWIHLPANQYRVITNEFLKETHCQLEVEANYINVNPVANRSDIPPIIVAAYDIEADSSHGDFPIAKKDYQRLARDIIMEYHRLRIAKDTLIMKTPRQVLHKWLTLAFDDLFQNYGINHVSPEEKSDGVGKLDIRSLHDLCESYSKIHQEYQTAEGEDDKSLLSRQLADVTNTVHSLFEWNLPPIDLSDENSSHYGLLAKQICQEYTIYKNRNSRVLQDPIVWLKYVLRLAYDPYFDNHNINRVYTKNNVKPSPDILENMVPGVYDICVQYYGWLQHPNPDQNQDYFVEQLTRFLNRHLPPVEGDIVIQIGTTYQRYGEEHPFLKHIITLGTCSHIDPKRLIADEHKDIIFPTNELTEGLRTVYRWWRDHPDDTLKAATEPTLIDGLDTIFEDPEPKRLVAQLTGAVRDQFNQLVLDFNKIRQYDADKSLVVTESYETEREVLLAWTRLITESDPDIIIGYNIFGFDFQFLYHRSQELNCAAEFTKLGRFKNLPQGLQEQNLSSSGLGENILYYIPTYGRVLADLFKVVQANHKLPMYNLNYVSKHFMYMSKNDLPPNRLFILHKGSADDRRIIAEYCLVDCILCNRLINKLEIITNNIGMSNVCMVPLSYLFLRGQGVKILSLVSMRCRQEGFLIPVLNKDELEVDGYEGAVVLEPHKGIYFEPIAVCDFNSLYPSCMISENLSHDSYVIPGSKYDNLPGYEYNDIEYDLYREEPIPGRKVTKKVKTGVKVCRFVQLPDGKKSLLPTILQDLLRARKDTRAAQAKCPKGSFEWKVKEGLQLAYKVTANSLYGQVGARTSAVYLKDIAACTTATGRNLIYFTKDFFEKNYPGALAVYGDTDSVFIKFDCRDHAGQKLHGLDAVYKSMELCTEGALAISRQLKAPHNLEFEKSILSFILISKKRYQGDYYTVYGSPESYTNSMGLVVKRRDNAPIVKDVFNAVSNIIRKEHNIPKAMNEAKRMAKDILEGKYSIDRFIITKTLKSYYKNPSQIAHNVLAQRIGKRDPGNKPQTNDRIPYVYIKIPDKGKEVKVLQGDRIETPEFIHKNNIAIDYKFYLTNQVIKPVSQIFALVTDDLASLFYDALRDYDYKMQGIRKITEWYQVKKVNRADYSKLNKEIRETLEDESDD